MSSSTDSVGNPTGGLYCPLSQTENECDRGGAWSGVYPRPSGVRGGARNDGVDLHVPRGSVLHHSRTQRCGQDHHSADPHDRCCALTPGRATVAGVRRWSSSRTRCSDGPWPVRRYAAVRREPDGVGEPVHVRPAARGCPRRRPSPGQTNSWSSSRCPMLVGARSRLIRRHASPADLQPS